MCRHQADRRGAYRAALAWETVLEKQDSLAGYTRSQRWRSNKLQASLPVLTGVWAWGGLESVAGRRQHLSGARGWSQLGHGTE